MSLRRNPKTKKLLALASGKQKIRLLAADRVFLRDLARLQVLSNDLANKHHYDHLKGGSKRSLKRLESAGIIKSHECFFPRKGSVTIYTFANEKIARAWGGRLTVIGARRNVRHEILASELYYRLDQPEDYHLANKMTSEEVGYFNHHRPDAVYSDLKTGEWIAVEADSGSYNKNQIKTKILAWADCKQVWGQPSYRSSRVPNLPHITVHQF